MGTPRLPFLYPTFFQAIKACEPKTYSSIRSPPRSGCRKLHQSPCKRQTDGYTQRYGPAAEGRLPPPPKPNSELLPASAKSTESARKTQSEAAKKDSGNQTSNKDDGALPSATELSSEETKSRPSDEPTKTTSEEVPPTPLDIVLSRPAEDQHRPPPHLITPPYVHHFDTYSLVRDLAKSGFTEDQAITIMKSVRLMLANNLDLAKEGLVSKSDVENEMYLFRAACSELRTSLQTSRGSEIQRQRTQRTHLQHEADILGQKVNQDLAGLKDDLRGMFNERKLAVQEEKRSLDGKIQQVNYEITVMLNSDCKSEIEGLRWVLTRRAALAIAISAGENPDIPLLLTY